MSSANYISYLRVSTTRQGQSGLGVEAQRDTVMRVLATGNGTLVDEFVEVESGRKASKHRPQLMAALNAAKARKAALIIAKLDRLARDVRFFLEVLDDSGVNIRFAEFADIDPKTDEGRMLLINMANFAEFEGRRIGSRTKAALAVAKARGIILGASGPENLRRNIEARRAEANTFAKKMQGTILGFKLRDLSQRQMVTELNELGLSTSRGGQWSLVQLQRVMERLDKQNAGV